MQPSILYIGHGSVRLVTKKGLVIYIDPFYPGDYSMPADIIIQTHNDQSQLNLSLVQKKDVCLTVTLKEAYNKGAYNIFGYKGITISSFEAYNDGMRSDENVGFLITYNNLKFYYAGRSEITPSMKRMTDYGIDYALFTIDRKIGMSPQEAVSCAEFMNVKFAIPVYNDTRVVNTLEPSQKGLPEFDLHNALKLEYGEQFEIVKK